MLRTQVLQRVRLHGLRTIGVISAVDSEGKTLTAINLAIAVAADLGHTALLIDLDLRNPSIAGSRQRHSISKADETAVW